MPVLGLEVINMGTPRRKIDADDVIRKYQSGKSVKALANEFGVSRNVIIQRLNAVGIKPRNRSEAMYLRMSQTPKSERQKLAEAAHEARRGCPNSEQMLHKRALAGKRFIGRFEAEFIEALKSAEIDVIPQEPFLSYNLDIGCGNVAVEIHRHTDSPLAPRHIKKFMNCVNSGKTMIYVWINPTKNIVTASCYDKVIALVKALRANPPAHSQYWVIRGTGETYATGCFDCD